ncbi:unnamed protein product [Closterium sp. Naga37s-1]|nr:unnamed protein product [Closterium sp. Naga37s-1]
MAGDAYDQVKEICIFLLSEAALPPGQALAVYVQSPGSPFEYRGAVHLGCPSAVLPLLWPAAVAPTGAVLPALPPGGVPPTAQIGISVEPIASLPLQNVGWQRRVEEMALKPAAPLQHCGICAPQCVRLAASLPCSVLCHPLFSRVHVPPLLSHTCHGLPRMHFCLSPPTHVLPPTSHPPTPARLSPPSLNPAVVSLSHLSAPDCPPLILHSAPPALPEVLLNPPLLLPSLPHAPSLSHFCHHCSLVCLPTHPTTPVRRALCGPCFHAAFVQPPRCCCALHHPRALVTATARWNASRVSAAARVTRSHPPGRVADRVAARMASRLAARARPPSPPRPWLRCLAAALLLLLVVVARTPLRGLAAGLPAVSVGGEAGPEHVLSLYRAWGDAYGLSAGSLLPPSPLSLPPSLLPAPHLEDCAALTALRQQAEQRGEGGELPSWAGPLDSCNPSPHPPWVRGTDAANLAMTRGVQRDIWASQFPGGSCADRRLLVVSWPPDHRHGVGSQVHVMTSFLSIAMRHNRTLVPDPLNYNRAYTDQCADMDRSGQWECYFFPLVSPECERVVMDAKDANSVVWGKESVGALCASQHRVVGVLGMPYLELEHEATIALRWGRPHLGRPSTVWFPPGAAVNDDTTPQVHWWRAQAVRFMLRWPSAHLCHVINQQRHTAYGMHDQAAVQGGVEGVEGVGAVGAVGAVGSGGGRRCDAVGGGGSSAAEAVSKLAGEVAREAYMVRPVVAVHVRGSDKEEEMGLLGLPVYMYYVHQLRLLLPDLRHAWINTESQAVIDSLASYREWTFLYSSNTRQSSSSNNTREYDDKQSVPASFASLLIASQADVFIGTLGSNWSRLMNELRSTNGRLFNTFIALNDGEW